VCGSRAGTGIFKLERCVVICRRIASNTEDTYVADAYLLAILSNCDTTFMDGYLHAIVSNYDELFGQLHLFNLAQRQLLQAICDDASEADLRTHLDSTLDNITDGANEEQGDLYTLQDLVHGKARLGPESPDMLARGRIYEKALGEVKNCTDREVPGDGACERCRSNRLFGVEFARSSSPKDCVLGCYM
jgi:hypothetical protein